MAGKSPAISTEGYEVSVNFGSNLTASRFEPYFIIILILTFGVPLLVLPTMVDNAFNTPKTLLMLLGVSVMAGIYSFQTLRGKGVRKSSSPTPRILIFLILINIFSFFYTANYYFTLVAAMMNITCLLFFYFASLYLDSQKAFWLMITTAVGGLLVSVETYLQFTDHFVLFNWAHAGSMVMGTIGNSNYLGAYFVFPLFATTCLIFLLKGKTRLIPVLVLVFMMGAFLFTRARAGWFGFFLALPVFLLLIRRIHRISIRGSFKANPRQVATYGVVILSLLICLWHAAPQRFHVMMRFRNITRSDTLSQRMKYYRASFWLFKQNPLFGTGLWSFRNLVYKAQAEINRVEKDFFKNYPEPKPRRVHNDYLETLNDGGLVASGCLLLFFIAVMRHGWHIIADDEVHIRDRTMSAAAFSSLIAIMLAALFFFPFRVNSTLFMTVVMMGIIEGIYLRNRRLISRTQEWKSEMRFALIPLVFLVLIGVVWFTGIKPFKAEMEHFKYKAALAQGKAEEAEQRILKAIEYDPRNSGYCLYASQLYLNVLKEYGKAQDFIESAIVNFNGDLTMWSMYYMKGLLKYKTGSLYEAQSAFEKSLYYNPTFGLASQKLEEVKKVIQDHDRVLIRLR
jgi:O-antigen ligase